MQSEREKGVEHLWLVDLNAACSPAPDRILISLSIDETDGPKQE